MKKILKLGLFVLVIGVGLYFLGIKAGMKIAENQLKPETATTQNGQSEQPAQKSGKQEQAGQDQDQNAKLDAWFETVFADGLRKHPQFMTTLGMKQDNDKWNNPSKGFFLEQVEETRQHLAHMRENFKFADLDESRQLSYRLFERQSQQQIDSVRWWDYGYTFNQMFGQQSSIPSFLIGRHRIDSVADATAYIARLNGVKAYLATHVENEKASVAKGIQPPLYVYGHVLRDARNIITGAPFDKSDTVSTLLEDFNKKISKLDISDAERAGLTKQAETALLTSFKPAYENLIAEMEILQATASTDDGVWKLPDGGAYYADRLKRMTTTDMSASEIHDLGLSEIARIHDEMRTIMKQVGFTGTLQEFFTHVKNDPAQLYEDSDAGRAAYMRDATAMIDIMETRLDEVFITKPKADLVVKQVEAFREKSAGKAFYNAAAPDGSRPGIYYANLYVMSDMPKYQMEALAYHEGIPGHHMQISIQQELGSLPMFRKYSRVTAYSEGWGLYSELLPKEMGFYQDPISDFGRLAMELWRAARLVVDTGLHDKKWTRQQAIDYLTTNTPNAENDAIKAIERYIVMPGQATAYKIGMLKILSLRETAKAKLGDKFDIREYHEVILGSGPVPLTIMEERVNSWVASKI
ncbi:MAG: DUF885 domain-containing protein [Robiginitomaculum sp.]|nr:MAG: DUF885 domain-containing protein [Robiginitomaculum sp.]